MELDERIDKAIQDLATRATLIAQRDEQDGHTVCRLIESLTYFLN